jgi:hypothetical protein
VALELLIEQRSYLTRNPAECEIAVRSDATHDITRLIQGAGQQAAD